YLRGEEQLSGWLVNPPGWYAENDVELVAATAIRLDTAARRVELDSGEAVGYAKLLLTTGGRNRRLEVAGAGLAGVHQPRTVAEGDSIKNPLRAGGRAVWVGLAVTGAGPAARRP